MAEWLDLPRLAVSPIPGRAAAVRSGETLDHAAFTGRAACWQAAWSQVTGREVALYFEDPFEFSAALYGAWHAGKTAVLPGDAQPGTLERLLPGVAACAGNLPGALQPAAQAACALQPLDPQAALAVIYTSGSSGQPIAIPKRLAQLDAEVAHLEQLFSPLFDGPQPPLIHSTVSHQHIYGLLFVALWPLAAGRPMAVQRISYPEEMAQQLGTCDSVLVSSPAHLRRLPESLEWESARRGLRAVFSSGGPLPPESAVQTHALLGQSPIEVYGSSETGGIAWRQRALHGDVWTPLPGVTWRLEQGTLEVRSAHLEDDGWWQTADLAVAHEGASFLLRGRADRIVKVEEKRVSLAAVEQALLASGLIAESRVLLVPAEGGSRLGVVAVPAERGWSSLRAGGKAALNEQLRAHLSLSFERVVIPRRFRYLRELPVNAQGKSTEALLLQQFEADMPAVRWLQRGETVALAAIEVTPQLRVFDGHFPGSPILPGVAQLDWTARLGREAFTLPSRFLRAEQLKFQQPVVPPVALELHMSWDSAAGQLTFQYRSAAGVHAGGRLVFGMADA